MRDNRITVAPPTSTPEERAKFFFGFVGSQFARRDKKTGVLELWWTGGDGHWARDPHFAEEDAKNFVVIPRLAEETR